MPMRIVCAACNRLLHNTLELVPLDQLLKEIDEECPECKRKLSRNPRFTVTVKGKPIKLAENNPKPSVQSKSEKWWRK